MTLSSPFFHTVSLGAVGLRIPNICTLCQVHVVAAVNSVCLGAATTLTQTLRSTLSSTKESLYEAWIVIAIAPLQHTLPKIGSDSVQKKGAEISRTGS